MNLLRADTKFPNTVYMGKNIRRRTKVDNPKIKISISHSRQDFDEVRFKQIHM